MICHNICLTTATATATSTIFTHDMSRYSISKIITFKQAFVKIYPQLRSLNMSKICTCKLLGISVGTMWSWNFKSSNQYHSQDNHATFDEVQDQRILSSAIVCLSLIVTQIYIKDQLPVTVCFTCFDRLQLTHNGITSTSTTPFISLLCVIRSCNACSAQPRNSGPSA